MEAAVTTMSDRLARAGVFNTDLHQVEEVHALRQAGYGFARFGPHVSKTQKGDVVPISVIVAVSCDVKLVLFLGRRDRAAHAEA